MPRALSFLMGVLLAVTYTQTAVVVPAQAEDFTVTYFWLVAPLNLSYREAGTGPVLVQALHPLQAISRVVSQVVQTSEITEHQPVNKEDGQPTDRIFTACVAVADSRCLIFTNRTGGLVPPLWNVTERLDTILYLPPEAPTSSGGGVVMADNVVRKSSSSSVDADTSLNTTTTPAPTPEPSDRRKFGDQLDNGGYERIPCPNATVLGLNASWDEGRLLVSEVYHTCISFYLVFVVADEKEINAIGTPGGSGTNNDNGRNRDHSDPSNEYFPSIYPDNPHNLTSLVNSRFTNKYVLSDATFLNMTSSERYRHILSIGHAFSAIAVFNGTTSIITNSGEPSGVPYGTILAIVGGITALGSLLILYVCLQVRKRRLAEAEMKLLNDGDEDGDDKSMIRNSVKRRRKKKGSNKVGQVTSQEVVGSTSYHPVPNYSLRSDSRWDPPRQSVRTNDSFCTMDTRATAQSQIDHSVHIFTDHVEGSSPPIAHQPVSATPPHAVFGVRSGSQRASADFSNNASFSQDDHQHLLPTASTVVDVAPIIATTSARPLSSSGSSSRRASLREADLPDREAIQ